MPPAEKDEFDALGQVEAAFARAIGRWEHPGPLPRRRVPAGERFGSLALAIINQQLSNKAAATIYGRVLEALGGELSPQRILDREPEALRAAGMSWAKVRALHGIARAVAAGDIDLEALDELSDDDAYQRLIALPGVGPWTAQVFLIFDLGRDDVLDAGDVVVAERHPAHLRSPRAPDTQGACSDGGSLAAPTGQPPAASPGRR